MGKRTITFRNVGRDTPTTNIRILSAYIPIKALHLTVISQATNQTIQFNKKETENKIQKNTKNLRTEKP